MFKYEKIQSNRQQMKYARHLDQLRARKELVTKLGQIPLENHQEQRDNKLGHVRYEYQETIDQNHLVQVCLVLDGLAQVRTINGTFLGNNGIREAYHEYVHN